MAVSSPNKKAIGPNPHPIFGAAMEFRKDPIGFMVSTAGKFPQISRFRFVYLRMVLLTDPEYIRHVLQINNKNYKKGIEYEHLKPVLGEGLLTSEGDFWLRQRRLAQPAFHRERIAGFVEKMVNCTDEMLNEWEKTKNNSFDLHAEMMHLALDIVGRTLLSTNVKSNASDVEHALDNTIAESYHRIQRLANWPLWMPVPRVLQYNRNRRILDGVVNTIISERRKSGEKFNDLLDMLMSAQDEETGEKMSDQQLRDEVMTVFLAGHETTANALTWTFYLLSQNPDKAKKMYDEADAVLQGKKPAVEDLKNLVYTQQVIYESLRMYPPAWAMGRTALSDDEIDGYKIKKGDNILIIPYVVHHDSALWESPEQFIPERFTSEAMKEMHKFKYFPFGGGPRFCIGNNFAMMEMQVVLAMAAQRFRLRLKDGAKVELDPLVTLRPKYGMWMEKSSR